VHTKNSKRLFYADLLRIFSVFGVIVIHVGASGWFTKAAYTWDWQIMNMWHDIFRWPVPLFIMISGMFNIEKFDTTQPLKVEIKKIMKKIFHIYCALVFWTLFYKIFVPVISSYNIKEFFMNPLLFLNIREIIYYPYNAIGGDSWFHLWFLYMIIGLYILTPFAKLFVENCKKNYPEYFLIIVFLIGMGIPFYNFVNTLKDIPLLPHRIYISIPELSGYIGYYIAGYYFSKYKLSTKVEYTIYVLGILSTLFSIFGTSFISIKRNELNQTLLSPTAPHMMFETIAMFLFIKNRFENANFSVICSNIITSISKCSFGIYLIHAFMITFVNVYFGIYWNTFNPIISVPIICILVFLLSYIVSLIISKIPILKKYII
jgi:surface polysaccharide O-acyltransferase-like enzyme